MNSSFGEFSGDTRVSRYASFIDGVTGSEGGSGGGGGDAVTVTGVAPDSAAKGASVSVTITGTGFQNGASVSLVNGCGPAPTVTNVQVSDATQITATITAKSSGPNKNCTFDVSVANIDGSSGVLGWLYNSRLGLSQKKA